MEENQTPMFENLEMDHPENAKEEKVRVNNLQENLLWLMKKHNVSLGEIQKETLISFSTLYSWFRGEVGAQLLDINVKELADFFNVTVDDLAFGEFKDE
jgi:hypothetical protein